MTDNVRCTHNTGCSWVPLYSHCRPVAVLYLRKKQSFKSSESGRTSLLTNGTRGAEHVTGNGLCLISLVHPV
jgi:hypothetical protein